MTRWTADRMPSLEGKTVVITGANSGLGYAGTKAFARKGATVVMACRSVERGERAAAEVRGKTDTDGWRAPELDVRECDLASLGSVRSFAEGVADAYDAVDVLCNNAGVMALPRREPTDGFERQLGVNHFGHFALTGRLFPLLRAGDGESRVVTQSSGVHETGEIDFGDLNWEQSYSRWGAYARSKLANLLFAYELQRRLEGRGVDGVKSVACHPGYADTSLQTRAAEASGNPLMRVGMRLASGLLAQSPERGALPMLYAATADVEGGAYVGPGGLFGMRGRPEEQRSSDASYDETAAERLWERSVEATGVEYPF